MTRRPRRVIPAVLLALALLTAAVAVIVAVVQRLAGAREYLAYDRVARELHAVEWGEAPVLIGGAAVLAVGVLLLFVALWPGRTLLVPLADEGGSRAGISRRGLRAAVRESAEGVDGVTVRGVRLRRRSVRVEARTDRLGSAWTADAVSARVSERLRDIGVRSVRRVRTSLRGPDEHTGGVA